MSIYPEAIDGFAQLPILVDTVRPVNADSVNKLRDAVVNIEKELGANPSADSESVKKRLDLIEDNILLILEKLERIEEQLNLPLAP